MKKIFEYIEELMADPARWHTHQQTIKDELAALIDRYAETRPHTLDQLIHSLMDEYPSLSGNYELLQKGLWLKAELMEAIFAASQQQQEQQPLTVDSAKLMEAKLSLFEKLLSLNATLNAQLEHIGGSGVQGRHSAKPINKIDSPGTAQKILFGK